MVEAQFVERAEPEPVEEAPKETISDELFETLVYAVSTGEKEVSEVLKIQPGLTSKGKRTVRSRHAAVFGKSRPEEEKRRRLVYNKEDCGGTRTR